MAKSLQRAVLTYGSFLLLSLAAPGCRDDGSGGTDAGVDIPDSGVETDGGVGEPDAGSPPPTADLAKHVDPFIGTDDSNSPFPVPGGAGGSTFPGATVPFGMLQLSPDTPTASPSGYRYSDSLIEHFSLTHFNGAGCPNNEDLPFLPHVGELTTSPAADWKLFRTGYDKTTEVASPGYYQVTLDGDIKVELTTTTRTGMVRLHYPASKAAQLLLHTGRNATNANTRSGNVQIVGKDKIRGSATAGGFCGSSKTYQIYFAAQFDRPFTASGTWLGNSLSQVRTSVSGTKSGAFATFDTTQDPVVQMKIGVSFVSMANAEANLAAENAGWDFDAVHTAARDRWNQVLNRIEITGGGDADLEQFYTALYHVFQNPNVASDVNGQYMGFDGAVHTAEGWTVYQNYSGWDIIRSWTHLISAIAPEAPDIIRSMVDDGEKGGLLPFWSHQNVEVNVMVGDPGSVNVANAYAMGVRGFDTDSALQLMLKSASNPDDTQRWNLSDWLTYHYAGGNAAMSLEYAMADFAISRYAGELGNTAVRDEYLTRSHYWTESWNPASKLIEPRAGELQPGAAAARIYEVQIHGTAAPATNLALNRPATASASCGDEENPSKAVNGTTNGGYSDKWCDNTSSDKWWRVDLGSVQSIDKIIISHAGAGGESSDWNTQDFTLSVSTDGVTFETVATVTGNTANVTTHGFTAREARYVKLSIQTAIKADPLGAWACQPLDPSKDCGFIEGNAFQYVWMVPHDLEGLFTRMGGHAEADNRLDELFTELNAGTRRPYFYIGNEPEHGTPWIYNFAQKPWKTQAIVRRIINETFYGGPGGLPGNDDLGSTSAWLVWSYLGMFPAIPGTDVLVINGPWFPSAKVHLANGHVVTIEGEGASQTSKYIQSLAIDGKASTKTFVRFADIAPGATLKYVMGDTANESWGSGEGDRPPSFAP
ncbi:Alpha-1,2-mannosidase [Cystobacter fuscus DSM 2262]|uniref:Alpha-1,2-mannosidase n=1 Tax=Cystobacter fuscus (strain ATCC 25194 / DSM 2262 / NBRC 100088 / M29) TaxID=1242864 RepID=S9PLK6_CYSF2|nr:Alpha-1,2-mannosidase [Cystobacter fuscus DSM 2262]